MSLWIQVTAGQGPVECAWVVARLAERVAEEAARAGARLQWLDGVPGAGKGTFDSVLLELDSDAVPQWLASYLGTVRWVGRSPFRPTHKRRNWHVGVSVLLPPAETTWRTGELRFETLRASGPGGQHVNKTESAVRVTHVPTGISVLAQEARSQHQNRRLALARLEGALRERTEAARARSGDERWHRHLALERGNPVRVFRGRDFRPEGS